MFMDPLAELQRCRILSRFQIQKGKSKRTFNFPYDKISVFIVIETFILDLPATNEKTSLNLRQFIEKYVQSIILIGVFRKFDIYLPVDFLHRCFLFRKSFVLPFLRFTSLFFVVFWKDRLQRFGIEKIFDLINKSSNLRKILLFHAFNIGGYILHFL